MNRGDYGKIPCIMGDYDTGIRGPLNPREWFAASDGHLYFVKADGVTVIDIYEKVLERHIKDGYHDTFEFKNGIHLKISQQVGQTSTDLCDTIIITKPTNGDKDWDLHINKKLSLGICEDGLICSNAAGTTGVIPYPLPLDKGGTNNISWVWGLPNGSSPSDWNGYLTVFDGNKIRSSPYYVAGVNANTNNNAAIAPSDWVWTLYNQLIRAINDLKNWVNNKKYAKQSDLDALKKRVDKLEKRIANLEAKNIPYFVVLNTDNTVDYERTIDEISIGGTSGYVATGFHLSKAFTRHQAEGPSGVTKTGNVWGSWCNCNSGLPNHPDIVTFDKA